MPSITYNLETLLNFLTDKLDKLHVYAISHILRRDIFVLF